MLTNRRSTVLIPPTPTTTRAIQPEPHNLPPTLLTSTTTTLPGYRILKLLGTVTGSSVRASSGKHKKSDFSVRDTASAELKHLTQVLYSTRDQAQGRMEREVVARGGNAVVGVGFGDGEILGCVRSSVWGTAVLVEKIEGNEGDVEQYVKIG